MKPVGLFLCLALLSHAAVAQDVRHACTEAATRGQELRLERRWSAARDQFRECSREECPAIIREACEPWLAEATAAIPSLVLRLSDASDGLAIPEPKAFVDGRPVRVSGEPLELEPGPHLLRITGTGYAPHEERVTMREGERGRVLAVALEPLPFVPPLPLGEVPPPPYAGPFKVLGASAAVAGLLTAGAGTLLYATGRGAIPSGCDRDTHVCATYADVVDAEAGRNRANVGVGLLLTGLVAAAVGGVLAFIGYSAEGRPQRAPLQSSPRGPAPANGPMGAAPLGVRGFLW